MNFSGVWTKQESIEHEMADIPLSNRYRPEVVTARLGEWRTRDVSACSSRDPRPATRKSERSELSTSLCYSHVRYPSGSPDFIVAIAACTGGLPLMPHHWNGRTGRDGIVRVEPGASAPTGLARRQAHHGRRRSALLTWERGEVAGMIYCIAIGKACRCTCLCTYCSSSFRIACHCSDCPAFFRRGPCRLLWLEVEAPRHLVPTI